MLWNWIKSLFKKRPKVGGRQASWPTVQEIMLLPWFDELRLEAISVISSKEAARFAFEELLLEEVVGFDTESKPTFVKGEKSTGPHVVQFSTLKHAYIFMLHDAASRQVACDLIKSAKLKKVGFGLTNDLKTIRSKLGVQPEQLIDLETLFAAKGYGRGVGVKVGVAIMFKRRFRKGKASTSNWAARQLSSSQLLYAANDAFAAIKVFHALAKA